MNVIILNSEFDSIALVDAFTSLIWTVRYHESGDFELSIPIEDDSLIKVIESGTYLSMDESDRIMIIEEIKITTDIEEGSKVIIKGHSIEQILDRRIILNRTSFVAKNIMDETTYPNLQNGILKLLDENITSKASISARRIDNFIYEVSDDVDVTKLTLEGQYWGETLYEVISKLCKDNKIGFKIILNEKKKLVFKLYKGEDRSYKQTKNPYIIFSPEYDNLLSSNYCKNTSALKNVAVVKGEKISGTDEETAKYESITIANDVGNDIGVNRRETFVDSSSISSEVDGAQIGYERYKALLRQSAIDVLMDNIETEVFEGEFEHSIMYTYGKDFFIGDIVQVVDEYGHEGIAYISEFIISEDKEGIKMYPTFVTIQKGDYDYE